MRKLLEAGSKAIPNITGNNAHRSQKENAHSQGRVENFVIQRVSVSNTITTFNTSIRILRRILPQKGVTFNPRINTVLA